MPPSAHENSLESRTQTIGNKRSSTNSSSSNRPRKRRRNGNRHRHHHHATTNNKPSATSPQLDLDDSSDSVTITRWPSSFLQISEPEQPDSVPTARWPSSFLEISDPNEIQGGTGTMANEGMGRNRLATGFVKHPTTRQDSKSSGEISSSSSVRNIIGKSSASPIQISDDEMEESEGGMVINLDHDNLSIHSVSSDEKSQESGEIAPTPVNKTSTPPEQFDLFVVDPTPTLPVKRLSDLSSDELEDQIKYALFYLDRDQIDLSRPVSCLVCAEEGHLHHDCTDIGTDIFPLPKTDLKRRVKLWISCCLCASKSHLVGDCPQLQDGGAARWSLKAINPENIVNLSLESGTMKLEQEAKNNGMRPAGLQIKGRAGLHQVGASRVAGSSEDDEPFLRRPVGKARAENRGDSSRMQRYDRFDPPSDRQPYRGGGQWYTTDSFGRRRSRSPDDLYDSYRPRDDFTRPRASPQRDNWRPPPDDYRQSYQARPRSPPRGNRGPTASSRAPAARPGPNIQISLPTRKGSNTWSQSGQSGNSTPTNDKSLNAQQSKRKRNKNRKKGPHAE